MNMINAVGRRKTSVARVFLFKGKGKFIVNKKKYQDYFPTQVLQGIATESLRKVNSLTKFDVKVNINGGGISGQAQAIRHGLARALVKVNEENKAILKSHKLLTRDSRMVERKKPGQPKARKKFQFSKR